MSSNKWNIKLLKIEKGLWRKFQQRDSYSGEVELLLLTPKSMEKSLPEKRGLIAQVTLEIEYNPSWESEKLHEPIGRRLYGSSKCIMGTNASEGYMWTYLSGTRIENITASFWNVVRQPGVFILSTG